MSQRVTEESTVIMTRSSNLKMQNSLGTFMRVIPRGEELIGVGW
jgi:hypothetical protein